MKESGHAYTEAPQWTEILGGEGLMEGAGFRSGPESMGANKNKIKG